MGDFSDIFKNKRNLINLLLLIILILAIPITIEAFKRARDLNARADVTPIELMNNPCVVNRNGQQVAVCPEVTVKLTSPLGGPQSSTSNQ
jgi:hypothetical protein